MSNYIDGFVLPIAKRHTEKYKEVVEQIAAIWREHGALAYHEYMGDDMHLEGTASFQSLLKTKEDEQVIFGWVVFKSKADRDLANEKVAKDPRMTNLISPLIDPNNVIFDAKRMMYGGFKTLVESSYKPE